MIELICCLGLHWILKYGTILNKFRSFIYRISLIKKLFQCSLCLGFWCGLLVGVGSLKIACASAGFCWFFDNLNNILQRIDLKLENESK